MALWAVPALLLWLTPYRFGKPGMKAIGQLAAEPDYFLKRQALGDYPSTKPILFNKGGHPLNRTLLEVWARDVRITTNRVLYDLIRPFEFFPFLRIDFLEVLLPPNRQAQYQAIVRRWGDREPIFRLPGRFRPTNRPAVPAHSCQQAHAPGRPSHFLVQRGPQPGRCAAHRGARPAASFGP